jgi:hypothetical protein
MSSRSRRWLAYLLEKMLPQALSVNPRLGTNDKEGLFTLFHNAITSPAADLSMIRPLRPQIRDSLLLMVPRQFSRKENEVASHCIPRIEHFNAKPSKVPHVAGDDCEAMFNGGRGNHAVRRVERHSF